MPQQLTDTEIANLALSKLGPGGGYLTSLETDDTEAAEALRRVYVAVRDEVLEAHAWRFARKRDALAADPAPPTWGFALQYTLPSDCLKVLAVKGYAVNWTSAFEEEDGKLLTDITAPLYIRYLARVTNTGKFSPTFVAALAARLADEVCEVITKSSSKREKLQSEYLAKLKAARRSDNLGAASQPPPDGAWNDGRR